MHPDLKIQLYVQILNGVLSEGNYNPNVELDRKIALNDADELFKAVMLRHANYVEDYVESTCP